MVGVNSGDPANTVYVKAGSGSYRRYDGPVTIDRTTRISIYAQSPDGEKSPEISAVFHKMKDEMDIYTDPQDEGRDGHLYRQ